MEYNYIQELSISCTRLSKIGEEKYADNLAAISRSTSCLQQSVNALHTACVKWDMSINIEIKFSVCMMSKLTSPLMAITLQNDDEFCYLGSVVHKSEGCCEEIKNRIVKDSAFSCWQNECFPILISLDPLTEVSELLFGQSCCMVVRLGS